jgi:pSer/pThr/pTyr-binding forkhead associated (FHA) protein
MRLVVKQNDNIVNEFQFAKGPVYIGRHRHSQVFLHSTTVSRQHAVIFCTDDGKWMVEDFDSPNKTYLNEQPIHKAEIKDGDILRITDYTIEINLEKDDEAGNASHLGDTIMASPYEQQILTRKLDSEQGPVIKLPAKRARDFIHATETICETNGLEDLLRALLRIAAGQFAAYHAWCALRGQPTGPMACYAGKRRDGKAVPISDIQLRDKIDEAVEKGHFMLFPQFPVQVKDKSLRSAIIAPILNPAGCFGVLYIDNAMDHERYTISDMDYMMLIAIHTAAILKNF